MNTNSDKMVLDKEEDKKDSSSSDIGVDSDKDKPVAEEEEDESTEVQSTLDDMSSALGSALGIRSGISPNYSGRSESFLDLSIPFTPSDSAQDLGKKVDPAARKRKITSGILQRQKSSFKTSEGRGIRIGGGGILSSTETAGNQLSTTESFGGIGLLSSIPTGASNALGSSVNLSSSVSPPVPREPLHPLVGSSPSLTSTAESSDDSSDGNRRPISSSTDLQSTGSADASEGNRGTNSSSTDLQSPAGATAADGSDGNPRVSTSSTASNEGVDRSPERQKSFKTSEGRGIRIGGGGMSSTEKAGNQLSTTESFGGIASIPIGASNAIGSSVNLSSSASPPVPREPLHPLVGSSPSLTSIAEAAGADTDANPRPNTSATDLQSSTAAASDDNRRPVTSSTDIQSATAAAAAADGDEGSDNSSDGESPFKNTGSEMRDQYRKLDPTAVYVFNLPGTTPKGPFVCSKCGHKIAESSQLHSHPRELFGRHSVNALYKSSIQLSTTIDGGRTRFTYTVPFSLTILTLLEINLLCGNIECQTLIGFRYVEAAPSTAGRKRMIGELVEFRPEVGDFVKVQAVVQYGQ